MCCIMCLRGSKMFEVKGYVIGLPTDVINLGTAKI